MDLHKYLFQTKKHFTKFHIVGFLKYRIIGTMTENIKETPKYMTGNENLAISQCRVRNGKKMNEKDIRKKTKMKLFVFTTSGLNC